MLSRSVIRNAAGQHVVDPSLSTSRGRSSREPVRGHIGPAAEGLRDDLGGRDGHHASTTPARQAYRQRQPDRMFTSSSVATAHTDADLASGRRATRLFSRRRRRRRLVCASVARVSSTIWLRTARRRVHRCVMRIRQSFDAVMT